jgi:hypothetical protein
MYVVGQCGGGFYDAHARALSGLPRFTGEGVTDRLAIVRCRKYAFPQILQEWLPTLKEHSSPRFDTSGIPESQIKLASEGPFNSRYPENALSTMKIELAAAVRDVLFGPSCGS